jgi:hypothetical protein
MKPVVAAVVSLTWALAAACGSDAGSSGDAGDAGGAATPEKAVRQLMTSLEAGSCDDVRAVVVTPDLVDCEMIGELEGGYAADGVDLDGVRLETGEVVDGSTTVTASVDGQDDETWQVERVDGSWRVLLDSEE